MSLTTSLHEAKLEKARRVLRERRRTTGFKDFIRRVNRRYRFFWHCSALIDVLERVERGELKRVMVFMPPRHGKSELVSRLFAAWFVFRRPEWFVGLACYGQDLADQLSRAAQNNFIAAGGKTDSSNVRNWTTPEGGGMWCAGVGGPITGKGAHVLIVDDPLKGEEDSNSPTQREKLLEWFDSVFLTREEPWSDTDQTAALIIVQTRWHEADLAGALLDRERQSFEEEEDPERWHIVCMEGLKEPDPPEFPDTCTLEPDPREPGEALCPERRSGKWLERLRRRWKAGYWWAALFQQRPRPLDGTLIKRKNFKYRQDAPSLDRWIRFYDTSLVRNGDKTGTGLIGKLSGKYVLDKLAQISLDAEDLVPLIVSNALSDPPGPVAIERATCSIPAIRKLIVDDMLCGRPLVQVTTKGRTKLARALGWITEHGMGNVYLVAGDWNADAVDVLCRFKGEDGDEDDLVDGISVGHAAIYTTPGGKNENTKPPKRGSLEERLPRRDESDDDDRDGYDDD